MKFNKENAIILGVVAFLLIAVFFTIGQLVPTATTFYQSIFNGTGTVLQWLAVIIYFCLPFLAGAFVPVGLDAADDAMGDDYDISTWVKWVAFIGIGLIIAVAFQLILMALVSHDVWAFTRAVKISADPLMLIEAPFNLWGFLLLSIGEYLLGGFIYVMVKSS